MDGPPLEGGAAALIKYGCPSPSATHDPAGGNMPAVNDEDRRSAAGCVGVLFALLLLCGAGGGGPSAPANGGGLQPLLLRAKSVCEVRIAPLRLPLPLLVALLWRCRLPWPMGELEVRLCAETERRGCVGGSGVDAVGGVEVTAGDGTLFECGRCVCGFGMAVDEAAGPPPLVTAAAAAAADVEEEFAAAAAVSLSGSDLRTGEGEKDSGAVCSSVGET